MEKTELTSYKTACIIARFLDEKNASDISILNISNVSSFADYFVICSASSTTQVKALTENVSAKIKQNFELFKESKHPLANNSQTSWNVEI